MGKSGWNFQRAIANAGIIKTAARSSIRDKTFLFTSQYYGQRYVHRRFNAKARGDVPQLVFLRDHDVVHKDNDMNFLILL